MALPPILTSIRIISSQVSPEILHFPPILDGRMEQLKSPWPQYSFDFIQILDIWSLTPPNEDSSFPPGDQLVTTWCPKWDHIVNYQCHFKLYNINNLFKIQTTDRIIPMPSAQYWLFWRTRVKTHVDLLDFSNWTTIHQWSQGCIVRNLSHIHQYCCCCYSCVWGSCWNHFRSYWNLWICHIYDMCHIKICHNFV